MFLMYPFTQFKKVTIACLPMIGQSFFLTKGHGIAVASST